MFRHLANPPVMALIALFVTQFIVAADAPPENAHMKVYSAGWECDVGYSRAGDGCVEIAIPENAYADGATCREIVVPERAFLSGSDCGPGWRCARGYRHAGDRCGRINVPINAHLDFGGDDWNCNKPFRKRDSACVLPEPQ